jgi:hypothetical protein
MEWIPAASSVSSNSSEIRGSAVTGISGRNEWQCSWNAHVYGEPQ